MHDAKAEFTNYFSAFECRHSTRKSLGQGWRQEFSDGGVDSSDEGAKIWFSGYYKCQKSSKKSLFTFRRGASMLRRGLQPPLALPWRHPCSRAGASPQKGTLKQFQRKYGLQTDDMLRKLNDLVTYSQMSFITIYTHEREREPWGEDSEKYFGPRLFMLIETPLLLYSRGSARTFPMGG